MSTPYNVAHACFGCRKSFKIPAFKERTVCPNCGTELNEMGRSFTAPKARDTEQWKKVERLWQAGFRFWSYRRYPDAEKYPDKLNQVDEFIRRNPDHPMRLGDG